MYYICLLTDNTYIIEIIITVTVKNISIANCYNYYTFTGRMYKQGTNTLWPTTDTIMYMSPGDIFNATCRCIGYQSASIWKVLDKDGIKVDNTLYTSADCNIVTGSCIDIFLPITEPFIVLCFTSDFYDSTIQYSQPVVINIQGII